MNIFELIDHFMNHPSFGPIVLAAFGLGSAGLSALAAKKSNDANKKADKVEEEAKGNSKRIETNSGQIEDHTSDILRANRSLADMIVVMKSLNADHERCVEREEEWLAVRGKLYEILQVEPPRTSETIETESPLRRQLLGILERRISGRGGDQRWNHDNMKE